MGNLFPDSDEYPDYKRIPRFTARLGVNGPGIPLAVAATIFGLCPVVIEDHAHPPHQEYNASIGYAPGFGAVSSTGGNDVTVALTGVEARAEIGRMIPSVS
jgi:hypothetical protein